MTKATDLIAAERQRQIDVEGYDSAHDADHADELAQAGAAYAVYGGNGWDRFAWALWPWGAEWWKPKNRIANLTRAGALIAAALDEELLGQQERIDLAIADTQPADAPVAEPTNETVLIFINHGQHKVEKRYWTVADLLYLPTPSFDEADTELWCVVPAADDEKVDHGIEVFDGLRLFTAPRFINFGQPTTTDRKAK